MVVLRSKRLHTSATINGSPHETKTTFTACTFSLCLSFFVPVAHGLLTLDICSHSYPFRKKEYRVKIHLNQILGVF